MESENISRSVGQWMMSMKENVKKLKSSVRPIENFALQTWVEIKKDFWRVGGWTKVSTHRLDWPPWDESSSPVDQQLPKRGC